MTQLVNNPSAAEVSALDTLVAQWLEVRKKRKELDDLSEKLKRGPEAELKARILMWLESQNALGIKLSSGTISKNQKSHVEVANTEMFLRFVYDNMTRCIEEGRPLADGLMLQKTPLKSGIIEHVRATLGLGERDTLDTELFNTVSATFGISYVTTEDLSFTSKR